MDRPAVIPGRLEEYNISAAFPQGPFIKRYDFAAKTSMGGLSGIVLLQKPAIAGIVNENETMRSIMSKPE